MDDSSGLQGRSALITGGAGDDANATGDFSFSGTDRALAEQLTSDQSLEVVVAFMSVAAAVVFVMLVRQLTQRHTRLTGEAAR